MDVLRLVFGQAITVTGVGLLVGSVGALVFSRAAALDENPRCGNIPWPFRNAASPPHQTKKRQEQNAQNAHATSKTAAVSRAILIGHLEVRHAARHKITQ
jgi:hypothetical protein